MERKSTLIAFIEREHAAAKGAQKLHLAAELALLLYALDGDAPGALELLPSTDTYDLTNELRRLLLCETRQYQLAAELLETTPTADGVSISLASLLHESALLRMYALADPAAAVTAIRAALQDDGAFMMAQELQATQVLALQLSDDTEELVELAEQQSDLPTRDLLLAAFRCADVLRQPRRAAALVARALDDDSAPLLVEFGLELSHVAKDALDQGELLERKLQCLQHEATATEAITAAYQLATLSLTRNDLPTAIALLDRVEQALQAQRGSVEQWTARIMMATRLELLVRGGDLEDLAQIYLARVEAGASFLAVPLRVRAAFLLYTLDSSDQRIDALLTENQRHDAADPWTSGLRELRLLQAKDFPRLYRHYESQAALDAPRRWDFTRRAALVAEIADDRANAARLRCASAKGSVDPFLLGDLFRLRKSDQKIRASLEEALDELDPGGHSDLYCVLQATRAAELYVDGQDDAALKTVEAVLAREREDPICLLLLNNLSPDGSPARRAAVHALARASTDPTNRSTFLLARAQLEGDPDDAIALLEQSRALAPDAPDTLRELADAHLGRDDPQAALPLYLRLLELLTSESEREDIELQIADLHLGAMRQPETACEWYQRPLERNPQHYVALAGMCAAYEQLEDRLSELPKALERLIALESATEQQSALTVRLASALERLGELDRAISAHVSALELSPSNHDAYFALRTIARREDRWRQIDELLRALTPQHEKLLELRAEALAALGDLTTLTEVRRELLGKTKDLGKRADRRYDLALVLEQRGALDEAAAEYTRAAAATDHRQAVEGLCRIHRTRGNHPALLQTLERLAPLQSSDEERADLLLELATLQENFAQETEAAKNYEQVLDLTPGRAEALDGLERLYADSMPLALAKLLRRRAQHDTSDRRSAYLLRAGSVFERLNEPIEAHRAYREAVEANPGHREAFTEFERYCYENELWREIMEVYDQLIVSARTGQPGGYRLGDLLIRRGQVQLSALGHEGEALASLWQALEADPKADTAMAALTNFYVNQQDVLGLIQALEQRADLVEDDDRFRVECLREAAQLATSRLDDTSDEPLRLWQRVVDINPADDEALAALIRFHRKRWNPVPLADALETRVAVYPDHPESMDMRLELSRICEFELDQPVRAARGYEKVLELEEHHEDALKALARIYEAVGDWKSCLRVLNGLVMLEADPDERSLLYFKCGSITETRFEDDDGAIALYRRSLEESPGCLPAIHGLRDLHLRQSQWPEAIATLELELEIWDGNREQAGVLSSMGQLQLAHMGNEAAALASFHRALDLDPDCLPALEALFEISVSRKEDTRALELASRLEPKIAQSSDVELQSMFHRRYASLLTRAGDPEEAASHAARALELQTEKNEEALEVLLRLATVAPFAHDYSTVLADLEQRYREHDDSERATRVRIAAGQLAQRYGDADLALEHFDVASKTANRDATPTLAKSELLVLLGHHDDAMRHLEQFAAKTKSATARQRALLELADIQSAHLGRPEAAIPILKEIASESADALFRLVEELAAVGRLDEAQNALTSMDLGASGRTPEQLARYKHLLGVLLLQKGDEIAAMHTFREALQLSPTNTEAALALAQLHARNDDLQEAEALLSVTIAAQKAVSTQQGELRRYLAAILINKGEPIGAMRQLRTLIRDDIAATDDLLSIAELEADTGLLEPAMDTLTQQLAQGELSPRALELLADLHQRHGEPDRALLVLRVAEALGHASGAQRRQRASLERQYAMNSQRPLDARRRRTLLADGTEETVDQLFHTISSPVRRVFPIGAQPKAIDRSGVSDRVLNAIDESIRLLGADLPVQLMDGLPTRVTIDDTAGLWIDVSIQELPLSQIRFSVGRIAGLAQDGYGLLDRLPYDDRQLLEELLLGLMVDPNDRSDLALEFLSRLPTETVSAIDKIARDYHKRLRPGDIGEHPGRWLEAIEHRGNAYGLLGCDDVEAAMAVIGARESRRLGEGLEGLMDARSLPLGTELIQFALSPEYAKVRRYLTISSGL